MRKSLAVLLGAILGLAIGLGEAQACACCTNIGQRYVGMQKFDAQRREQLEELRFNAAAQLYFGEADPADVKGVEGATSEYEMHLTLEPGRWIFDFRDKDGRTGTLALSLPGTISIFEVDPRLEDREGGTGPALYKEWTLTSKAVGTGIFAAGLRSGGQITLVLHGGGNSCTSLDHFRSWTLDVQGPKASYHFIGTLVP